MRDLAFYSSWLRVCAKCGRGLWWRTQPIDLYCSACWLKLDFHRNRSFSLLQDSLAGPLKTAWFYSLFTWTPESEAWVKPLLYQLKRGGLPEAYGRLADHFAYEMNLAQKSVARAEPPIFVVPPTRGPRERDHAWLWALELAERWGGRIWCGLKPADESPEEPRGSQKMKTRQQRRTLRYELTEALPAGKNFIFVDDVLTTGATAEAVWRALKEPHCFQVWVIAYRPKLAGFSSIC